MERMILIVFCGFLSVFGVCCAASSTSFLEEKARSLSVSDCKARARFRPGNTERALLFDQASRLITALLKTEESWSNVRYKVLYENYQRQLTSKLGRMHRTGKKEGEEGLLALSARMREIADLASEEMLPASDVVKAYDACETRAEFLAHLLEAIKPSIEAMRELREWKDNSVFPSVCAIHGQQCIELPVRAIEHAAPDSHDHSYAGMRGKLALAVVGGLLIDAAVRKERSVLWAGLRVGREAALSFWRWITVRSAHSRYQTMPTYRESLELARELEGGER